MAEKQRSSSPVFSSSSILSGAISSPHQQPSLPPLSSSSSTMLPENNNHRISVSQLSLEGKATTTNASSLASPGVSGKYGVLRQGRGSLDGAEDEQHEGMLPHPTHFANRQTSISSTASNYPPNYAPSITYNSSNISKHSNSNQLPSSKSQRRKSLILASNRLKSLGSSLVSRVGGSKRSQKDQEMVDYYRKTSERGGAGPLESTSQRLAYSLPNSFSQTHTAMREDEVIEFKQALGELNTVSSAPAPPSHASHAGSFGGYAHLSSVSQRSSTEAGELDRLEEDNKVNLLSRNELDMLGSELHSALERLSLLQNIESVRLRAQHREREEMHALVEENKRLKARLKQFTPVVEQHAPHLIPPADADALNVSNVDLAPSEANKKSDRFDSVPFESDSPMLSEQMERFERELDYLRQSIKMCVKSGVAFVSSYQNHYDAGAQFAKDLSECPNPDLQLLGHVFAEKLKERDNFLFSIDSDFIQPLGQFSRDEMKQANRMRSELERKREAFEQLESRFLAHKRGNADKTALNENPDRIQTELKACEVNFEVARCGLIKELNALAARSVFEISDACHRVVNNMQIYFSFGQVLGRQAALLSHMGQPAIDRRLQDIEAVYAEKCALIQATASRNVRWGAQRADAETNTYFEGWLYKRSSNVIKDWKKRFFQIRGGALYYFRGNERTECLEELGLCHVRPLDLREGHKLAFEVISNKKSVALLATSEEEKDAWVHALRAAVEREIGKMSASPGGFSPTQTGQTSEMEPLQKAMLERFALPIESADGWERTQESGEGGSNSFLGWSARNQVCVECTTAPANWVSVNLGIFICLNCSGLHRGLGVHVSKVRSLQFDHLPPAQLEILLRIGNVHGARIWESKQSQRGIVGPADTFLHSKYVQREYVEPVPKEWTEQDVLAQIALACADDDILAVASWVARAGSGVLKKPHIGSCLRNEMVVGDASFEFPLHCAAQSASGSLCEFLLLNGAGFTDLDSSGRDAMQVARQYQNVGAMQVLNSWMAESKYGAIVELVDI